MQPPDGMADAYRKALVNLTVEGNEVRRERDTLRRLLDEAREEIAALKEENERLLALAQS